ncbi:MAG TPA: PAS domain S-box protein, partial [Ktedonobacterales bacterium]|nr:PAS domain S-box protein [Ktedonobacterales bacterium]
MIQRAEASEARYRALAESALDAIIGMDAHGRITDFNSAAERMFGYTRETALGQRVADLIIPEAYREQHRQGLARYLETGASAILGRRLAFTALRGDGTEFPIELSVVRLSSTEHDAPEFMASIRDVTIRQREEGERTHALAEAEATRHAASSQTAELAATFEAMTDAVLVFDPDARIMHSNTAAHKMFGYREGDNFERLSIEERRAKLPVRDASGRPLPIVEFPQIRALGGESLTGADSMDMRLQTLYGTEIEVSCSAAPLRDTDGAIVGAVAVYRDVTERRRLEHELNERAHDLE